MDLSEISKDFKNIRKINWQRNWEPFLRKYHCSRVCELGVYKGENFERMIAHSPTLAVAVDLWRDDEVKSRNDVGYSKEELEDQYEYFKSKIENLPNVQIIRDYTVKAAELFPDNYFDFVYIDADHSTKGCYADILAWYPKVKPGKFLAGHDYRRGFGVPAAVDKFVKDNNLELTLLSPSNWLVVKPENIIKTKKTIKIVGFHSGHDISYCILENGIPVIHEEAERITRRKMEHGDGLQFFLSRVKEYSDINYFTFGNFGGRTGRYRSRFNDKASEDKMNQIINENHGQFFEFGHHLSHGANAFYTSDFDKALIIAMDGGGWEEGFIPTSFTIDEGIGNRINRLKIFDQEEINLGKTYNKSTRYVFDLSNGLPGGDQSGTVMAMATLGESKYTELFANFRGNWRQLWHIARRSEQEKFNAAASLQEYTEQKFYSCIRKYIEESDHENLVFSGGVSLNCVMLGKIKKWFPQIKNVFCDPVPFDAGLSLGSARYLWHHVLGNPRIKDNINNISPYLGKTYTEQDVTNACALFSEKITIKQATDEVVLQKINDQKIVAVYGGRSESGKRALGNRSILADPRNKNMKQIINDNVKHRAWFRPLAPSILEEKVLDWFEEYYDSPYMSFAVKFKEERQEKVPAVVHFDGTARLQTVNKQISPWYYSFLSKWEALSGIPMLVNTSFNDSEPIVETPTDALKCFLKTEIDYLYFFEYGILVGKNIL